MSTSQLASRRIQQLGILSTLIDAGVEFANGRSVGGVMLLGAAALSSRFPGLGLAASVLLRVYRRLR